MSEMSVKIAAILSKIIFLCAEKHMHIFNMLLIAVQSFKMNAWKPWEELITQSYYLLLKPSLKIIKVHNAVILSKIIFLSKIKSHAHLQYAYNIREKFQIDCLKTLGGVDYTNLLPNIEAYLKIV